MSLATLMNAIAFTETPTRTRSEKKLGRENWIAWLPLAVLPATVLPLRSVLAPWLFMWLLAIAVFTGCKWQTWWTARTGITSGWKRSAGYLLLWPGMDAREFLGPRVHGRIVEGREWPQAFRNALAGALLFWSAARFVSPTRPL